MTQQVIIYKTHWRKGFAARQYEKDLQKRQKQGWRLVSVQETGRDLFGRPILTAIYEK
jgi:hypothetical protein